MLIDRGHWRWFLFSTALLVVAAVAYALYAKGEPGGPSGGSAMGLAFGIAGTVCILFAALLGTRKRRPHYRFGRTASWLKGHLWLGALSLPLVLFHGGFEFGGPLSRALMWIFVLVFLTGILGLALQQFLPRFTTQSLPQETVYEQIEHVCRVLTAEAEQLAKGGAGRIIGVARVKSHGSLQGRVVAGRASAAEPESGAGRAPLVRFVDKFMKPYFTRHGVKDSPLHDPHGRAAAFEILRETVDPGLHDLTRDLEAICEQRRQLEAQRRLHHWMYGWLLIHVPLSWTMVFLTAVHAVMSLYY
ncbi:MAG: hypothetical protein ACYTEZ_03640 [Planctomycetota bacterium]